MATTKALILAALNADLKRSESQADIDTKITDALATLSRLHKWDDLYTTDSTQSIVVGGQTIAHPTRFWKLHQVSLYLASNTTEYEALKERPFSKIHNDRSGESSAAQGRPLILAHMGTNFEVYPTSDRTYETRIRYWQDHPAQEDILFGDAFTKAINTLVQMNYLEGKGLKASPKYPVLQGIFVNELGILRNSGERDPLTVEYPRAP